MNSISIVVPFLNEERLFPKLLATFDTLGLENHELVFVDSGSRDASVEVVTNWAKERKNVRQLKLNERPSIGKAVALGVKSATKPYVMILPVDTGFTDAHIREAAGLQTLWGCFPKFYDSNRLLLRWTVYLQNKIRLGWLGLAVWTNVLVIRKEFFTVSPVPETEFLEDVILVDNLVAREAPTIFKTPVCISSRKYHNDGIFKRVILNLVILFLYRCFRLDPRKLLRLYRG